MTESQSEMLKAFKKAIPENLYISIESLAKTELNKITQEIKLNCAFALASVVKDDELSAEYILPDALDMQVPRVISENVV